MRRISFLFALFFGIYAFNGCSLPPKDVTISFRAVVAGQPVACGKNYTGLGSTSVGMKLADFRFFVSNVSLVRENQEVVPLTLEQDGKWQVDSVALLDFEDGSGDCSANGNAEINMTVRGTVPAGEYTGLRFELGVPHDLNHADTATAPAPLNVGAMFWAWQTGHKFLRIDMFTDNTQPKNKWFIHLGSGGCSSDAPTTSPTTKCAKPNRPTYTFASFNAEKDVVELDLASLLKDVDISSDTPDTPIGCMSSPKDAAECTKLFNNFGMDFATGGASACGFDGCQKLFSVKLKE